MPVPRWRWPASDRKTVPVMAAWSGKPGASPTAETPRWCRERGHPWVTYNPWANRTCCRCGDRQAEGELPVDWQAKWAIFHDQPVGVPCRCYLPGKGAADELRRPGRH